MYCTVIYNIERFFAEADWSASATVGGFAERRPVKSSILRDAACMPGNPQGVVIAPCYGLPIKTAQRALKS
ncbi:NAD(P) transhydrogenase subunit beta [Caballeronia catudaia]|uniref:NAD(P) transhydrogenase subunit beta n=1 Tax=Caballeronia catudaia TaxID=1777136 RepID=A0A158C2V1_9BURK|nr:NAD(P) transhydrogenase subunit beta [Caballeronia catudaia]